MLLVLLGAAFGIAIGVGRVPVLGGVADAVAGGATSFGLDAVDAALRASGRFGESTIGAVLRTVVIALMPGIVAGVLLGCARSGAVLRRVGSLFAVIAAGWVLFTQDMPHAAVGALLLLIVGVAFAVLVGSALTISASAVSAMIATAQVRLLLDGGSDRFNAAATQLVDQVGVGTVELWNQVLAGSSAALPVIVLWSFLRD